MPERDADLRAIDGFKENDRRLFTQHDLWLSHTHWQKECFSALNASTSLLKGSNAPLSVDAYVYDMTRTSTVIPWNASVIPTKLPTTGMACRISRAQRQGSG